MRSLRSRLRPGAALWAVLLVPLVVDASAGPPGSRAIELVGGAVLLAVLVGLRDRAPLGVLCAAMATVAAAGLVLAPTTSGPVRVWPVVATAVFAYGAGRRMPGTRAVVGAVGAVAATGLPVGLLLGLASHGGARGGFGLVSGVYDWVVLVLVLLLAVGPAWLAGRYGRQRAALVAGGWERAALLERQQRLEADRARLAERARIAQDMHDSLGHEWTLIALRAAALEVSPRLDEDSRDAARELRAGVAAATERLREVIGVLRTDDGADPDERLDVAALVERAGDAGMSVRWDGGHERVDLPEMVRHAAHRVVREALTNAARHAPGAPVTVRLDHTDDTTTVRITNGPATSPAAERGGGTGLVGLHERVRLLGGTLRAGPAGAGFAVVAVLPHDGRPAAAPDEAVTESERHLERARGEAHRSLTAAVRVPLLAGAAVAVLTVGLFLLVGAANRLDPAVFERLPIGAARAAVEAQLPPFQVLDDPGRRLPLPSPGSSCRYYWSSEPTDERLIFRLCFADDRLVGKEAVPRAALSGPEGAP
ncbi:sensor histidine kinase [Pseudonocardia kunmingensis]|uniref:histidine kinase n=1 Tax=Pseudonocardia kunmingensis TaxID=630975 RepID=A0A543E0C0_9PSEU|nr:histidine kinase [Pseudonocardia kunmingensis]TQM14984.1 histidine kinase [Pseudonocardia kunmingensis]